MLFGNAEIVLVTRTLYRLRLTSEQRPFDSVSLNYMIPLICIVLRKHGVGQTDVDEADEQVTLALETLSFHTEICECLIWKTSGGIRLNRISF